MAVEAGQCWRVSRATRWTIAVVAALFLLAGLDRLLQEKWLDALVFGGGALTAVGIAFRLYVRLEPEELVVRNAIRTRRVPRRSIRCVLPGQGGLMIYTVDRGMLRSEFPTVTAWAVQRGPVRKTVRSADLVCDQIREWVTGEPAPQRKLGDPLPKEPLELGLETWPQRPQ